MSPATASATDLRFDARLWSALFGNAHPVAIEIGPGRGEFLLGQARRLPERNIFGIERSSARAEDIERKLARAGLPNVRVIAGDAPCVLNLLPAASVVAFHIQFPDPWWKRRHHRRRLLTPGLIGSMAKVLTPEGTIELMTDVLDYFTRAQQLLDAEPLIERLSAGLTTEASTTFARKAQQRGAPLYRSVHRRVRG